MSVLHTHLGFGSPRCESRLQAMRLTADEAAVPGAPPLPRPPQHVSIDPFQTTQWDNTAREQLRRAGLSHLSRVIEEPSYLAMPTLLREGGDFDLLLV